MKADINAIRTYFPLIDRVVYMNTATQAVGNRLAVDALHNAITQWSNGQFDWTQSERVGDENRTIFADLIGAEADEIALIPFVSSAAGVVAAQLGEARLRENIVVAEGEFTSNLFPWRLLANRGYEVRLVPPSDGITPAESYAEYVDNATRLIAVSAVHAGNGYRVDLSILSELAQRHGAWFFVDACQAAGAVPIKVTSIDFLSTASHKFLLGARGTGYLYIRRALLPHMTPVLAGWKAADDPLNSFFGPDMQFAEDASKLDSSLAWFNALADRASFQIFEDIGINAILQRNAALVQYLYDGLHANGIAFKAFPPQHRSTLVSVTLSQPEAAIARLREANVVASIREGRVRLALHAYNLESEIDLVITALSP